MSSFAHLPIGSVVSVAPSEIRFSQKSCSDLFGDGTTLKSTLDKLISKATKIADIPMIQVVLKENRMYTIDNRRLAVFKLAESAGECPTIRVRIANQKKNTKGRFTTECGGIYILIRGTGEVVGGSGGSSSINNALNSSGLVVAKAYFSKGDGDKAGRSECASLGVALKFHPSNGSVRFLFNNSVEQTIPVGWIDEIVCVVQEYDLVSAYFKDGKKKKSFAPAECKATVIGLNRKTGQVDIDFANDASQTISAWWVVTSTALGVGDRVRSYFKTSGSKHQKCDFLGVITSITSSESFEIYFDNGGQQSVPSNWINGLVESGGWKKNLGLGAVCAVHFKDEDEDGDIAKRSSESYEGVVLRTKNGFAKILYCIDNVVQDSIPIGWITELKNSISVGDFVESHWRSDGEKSASTYSGAVRSIHSNGDVNIEFTNGTDHKVPMYWVTKSKSLCIGDRVSTRFRSGKKRNDKEARTSGTVVDLPSKMDMSVYFDNGVKHEKLRRAWLWEISETNGWTTNIKPGSVVMSLFSDDDDNISNNAARGIVVNGGEKGYHKILFYSDAIQSVPCGWVEECCCLVATGMFVDANFKGDDDKKSDTACKGAVKHVNTKTGFVKIAFKNDVIQTVPGYYVEESQCIGVGDRVDSSYKGTSDNKKMDSDVGQGHGTVMREKSNSYSIRFDVNEAEQDIPKHWVKEIL